MNRPVLVVMVKAPRPGRVKTRLAAGIGTVRALWWYRHQCRALLRRLRDPRWALVLAVSPDECADASRAWPADLPRIGQGAGDLGVRMARLLARFAPAPVIIIGSDIPGIRRAHVARAFAALRGADAVLGPTSDGGYWLIGRTGLSQARGFLAGVRWSSEHALADTLRGLVGWRVAIADPLDDVDTADDLAQAEAERSGQRKTPPGRG